jgi:hypothetical protein
MTSRRLALTALLMLWIATWCLAHGYQGIRHDATLYTLQALAHSSPSLHNDVFLRFGSQDKYTIFSTIYSGFIGVFGLEPAAQILTFTCQLALLSCAALLLYRITPSRARLGLGVTVLIAIPGFYGANRVFSCIEPFLTPRMGAEALVLAGLAAAWNNRPRLAWGLVLAGMLVHPVMAAAGLVALALRHFGSARPRLALAVFVAGTLVLLAAGRVLPNSPWGTFDPEWLTLIQERCPYLFLSDWLLEDWGRTAIPLTTLALGARVLVEQRARQLCQVTLCTALAGLLLTGIAADASSLVIFTQLQPWRWQWLAVVVAALLIPGIVADGWRRSHAARSAVTLLIADWSFGSGTFALATSLVALTVLALEKYLTGREWRLLVHGAVAFALLALANRIASNLVFLEVHFADPQIPLWIRQTAVVVGDGSIPVALALLVVWVAHRVRPAAPLAILGVLAAGICVALLPDAWRRWTQQQFPAPLAQQLAPWRALIPPDANVFWSETPLSTWVLLDRPSYISVAQTTGILFSRASALELRRRAAAFAGVTPPQTYFSFSGDGASIGPSLLQLKRACATSEFEFLVTGARLPWPPVAELSREVSHSAGGLRLYRCSDRAG